MPPVISGGSLLPPVCLYVGHTSLLAKSSSDNVSSEDLALASTASGSMRHPGRASVLLRFRITGLSFEITCSARAFFCLASFSDAASFSFFAFSAAFAFSFFFLSDAFDFLALFFFVLSFL